jgi:sugar transferase EpsL
MEPSASLYQRYGKRLADVSVVLLLAPLVFPLIAVLAVVMWLTLGRPIFFSQLRAGRFGRSFTLWKFRTMTSERDPKGELLRDSARLTRFGRFMRSTSFDELPQFWNILRGDMSLVGPRPLLVQYLPHYTTEQARRHDVRPGVTGWAQVNGRNAISWEEKFQYDLWYVEHQSFLLDIRILLRTIIVMLSRRGVSAADHVTAPRFDAPTYSNTGQHEQAA